MQTSNKQTKMLHELIELANAGKKFKAKSYYGLEVYYPEDFSKMNERLHSEYIINPWQYEEIKEPRFRKEIVDMRNGNAAMGLEWMNGAKWEIVATEVIE